MTSKPPIEGSDNAGVEPSGFFSPGGGKRGAIIRGAEAISHAHSGMRCKGPTKTARARIEAVPARVVRTKPDGPTPERLAKGDVLRVGGVHRSIPPIERMRDQGKLDINPRKNQALYEAAEKLKRHYIAAQAVGVKAQDLNRIIGRASENAEDVREHNRKIFDQARTAMGWFEDAPHRGCGRLVVSVVCAEAGLFEAAGEHIAAGRKQTVLVAGMDRLRNGLWTLAVLWGLF